MYLNESAQLISIRIPKYECNCINFRHSRIPNADEGRTHVLVTSKSVTIGTTRGNVVYLKDRSRSLARPLNVRKIPGSGRARKPVPRFLWGHPGPLEKGRSSLIEVRPKKRRPPLLLYAQAGRPAKHLVIGN